MGGIGNTDNMCRIGDKPLQRINLIGDVTNEIKNTYNKTNNWYKEVKEVEKLGWDDGEKHKYMSCRTGQQGNDMSTIGLAAGLTKEAKDLTYKSLSPTQRKRYGGLDGVWEDSKKDMKNNLIGLEYGKRNPYGNCTDLTDGKKR